MTTLYETTTRKPTNIWIDALGHLVRNTRAQIGIAILVLALLVAVIGPMLTPYDFLAQNAAEARQGPSLAHWLGADELGRDLLSRIMYGARTAFLVAVVVTIVATAIGIALGATAGFVGGRVDSALSWFADVTMSVPGLLLVVVLNTSLRPPLTAWANDIYMSTRNPMFREPTWINFVLVFGTLALISWPQYYRIVRAQVQSLASSGFVTAANALGLKRGAIIRHHVVPNALGPLIVAVSAGLGSAMVLESAFSFLGVGVGPSVPSWGNMIADGLRSWRNYPHLLIVPAAVLALVTIAYSFLGDALNETLNPRGRK